MRNIIRRTIRSQQERRHIRIFRIVLRRNPEFEEVEQT
jgi:hypothetical protein